MVLPVLCKWNTEACCLVEFEGRNGAGPFDIELLQTGDDRVRPLFLQYAQPIVSGRRLCGQALGILAKLRLLVLKGANHTLLT